MSQIDLLIRPDRYRLAQFFAKVTPINGCWQWTAAQDGHGYGAFQGRQAHRVAASWFLAPIEDGFQVDHICRNRACVNPAHLDVVSREENLRRGDWLRRGRCQHGHILEARNIGQQKVHGRYVRICLDCEALRRAYERGRRRGLADGARQRMVS